MSGFPYRKVLVLGATSGIGKTLAEKFVQEGIYVIAVGRRQEKLDEFIKGKEEKASSYAFDITKLDKIPAFAQEVLKEHPDLDSVFLNSGIQRGMDFSKPETLDLDTIGLEMVTNYTSYIHLLKVFLPHLIASKKQTSVIATTSGLAMVPLYRCGNYCATKAALHQLILTLRAQLKNTNVKVIEIMPPAVQTELHDAKHQPDIENGRSIGMTIEDFLNESWDGLRAGTETIPVGPAKQWYDAIEPPRMEAMNKMNGGH